MKYNISACGPNTYGADCSGICSLDYMDACRKMYFCTNGYGCTCSVGLTGPLCDKGTVIIMLYTYLFY